MRRWKRMRVEGKASKRKRTRARSSSLQAPQRKCRSREKEGRNQKAWTPEPLPLTCTDSCMQTLHTFTFVPWLRHSLREGFVSPRSQCCRPIVERLAVPRAIMVTIKLQPFSNLTSFFLFLYMHKKRNEEVQKVLQALPIQGDFFFLQKHTSKDQSSLQTIPFKIVKNCVPNKSPNMYSQYSFPDLWGFWPVWLEIDLIYSNPAHYILSWGHRVCPKAPFIPGLFWMLECVIWADSFLCWAAFYLSQNTN